VYGVLELLPYELGLRKENYACNGSGLGYEPLDDQGTSARGDIMENVTWFVLGIVILFACAVTWFGAVVLSSLNNSRSRKKPPGSPRPSNQT
jgi:hypothetical protein